MEGKREGKRTSLFVLIARVLRLRERSELRVKPKEDVSFRG